MPAPQLLDHEMFTLLREDRVLEFNKRRTAGEPPPPLNGTNLRGSDLRGLNTDGLDLGDAYLRGADLRGLDLRGVNLEGASIGKAHLSGTYFPEELSATEILMSLEHGTRMRYGT